jgi:hypothetical protein
MLRAWHTAPLLLQLKMRPLHPHLSLHPCPNSPTPPNMPLHGHNCRQAPSRPLPLCARTRSFTCHMPRCITDGTAGRERGSGTGIAAAGAAPI